MSRRGTPVDINYLLGNLAHRVLATRGDFMESNERYYRRRAFEELSIPVYLYERAATIPQRENLADVRRGEFEGLRDEVRTNAARRPDFGSAELHPTAGATAVGARPFLMAYNVYLGDKSNLAVAKAVAKAVRGSSGGLRYVTGLGLEVDGQAQVSMNLVDTDNTPLHRVYEFVRNEAFDARRQGSAGPTPIRKRSPTQIGIVILLKKGAPTLTFTPRAASATSGKSVPSITVKVNAVSSRLFRRNTVSRDFAESRRPSSPRSA